MNFEKFQNDEIVPVESEKAQKTENKSKNGIGKWIKKTSAIVGVAGIGIFGNMHDASAKDNHNIENNNQPKLKHTEENYNGMNESNMFEVIYQDSNVVWGIEYIEKAHENGNGFLAQRYIKINKLDNSKTIIGEYNNLIEANDGLSKIDDIPDSIKKLAAHDLNIIKTEQAFQASGLVENSINSTGKIHNEIKEFKGYGIDVKNNVQVDESEKIVGIDGFKENKK